MNNNDVKKMLEQLQNGEIQIDEATESLCSFMDFGHVKPDTSRNKRLGFDEVIYGKAKTVQQISDIAEKYIENNLNFVCTGLDEKKISELEKKFPEFIFNFEAGIMKRILKPAVRKTGSVAVITAGTSDMKTALEASEILDICGVDSKLYADIGVAGIHRFFSASKNIKDADVIIVIAGMEGALQSITGGLFRKPVIAVPTSTGYGAALSGFTALFAMLSSCANGITVVNIDNGFGAAMAALRIINLLQEEADGTETGD
ncbi:MAG: 1-(5-phosphoribosyl)-5-amino-4-imidazole-carboxylate carboxylase [Denitrovibrio sp.]|nr:MAG: 1-(5-phosphoribosyl)-5-amino-4-imidazole-carboxylate carboxylase [Denitrovibrio sp.]